MRKRLLFIFLVSINSLVFAQNYHWWWYEIHEHDGFTPWQDYLIMSPAYFGPNAFPVPNITQGLIKTNLEIESALEGHFNSHEQTYNLLSKIFIPLLTDKVGLQFSIVPIEFFSHDTLIRDQRFSRNYEGNGHAYGDLYIGTQIQLIKDHPKWPDILIGINIRTASGNEFGSARFADSPGYFFDLGAGKSFPLKLTYFQSLRLYATLGFYAWQTNLVRYFQDDAVLYGVGFQLNSDLFTFSNELAGFHGYINNGDRPLVYRSRLQTTRENNLNFGLQFEHGINDFNFRSIRLSVIYHFE